MASLPLSNMDAFQVEHNIISKTRDKAFIFKLQILELRLNRIEIPSKAKAEQGLTLLIKMTKSYLLKILREFNFFSSHWASFKEDIINTLEPLQKKEIIKSEINCLKQYVNTKKGLYSDEINHTDILYIYWHSKTELKIVKRITSYVEFLDKEIAKLEKVQWSRTAVKQNKV